MKKRIIKFRAWEYVHERTPGKRRLESPMVWKMNYNPKVYGHGQQPEICLNSVLNESGDDALLNNKYPTTFMQFTGKYDKKGSEIYEGDIIKAHNMTGIVEYCDGFYADEMPNDDFLPYDVLSCEPKDIEIIGNIFENPEIIEKIKST